MEPISYMPGPIQLPAAVKEAFTGEPVSHRAPEFVADVQRIRAELCSRVNAKYVEILFGSATVANEALAAQLTLMDGRGLMLANGEFGERLIEQARCWDLELDAFEMAWGKPFDYHTVEERLAQGDITWLWFSHCETSTGELNDLERIKTLCQQHNVRCCVDCISSIGAAEINLDGVYLATGTSGKALGSYAGLGMVFYNEPIASSDHIPRYLDIGYYAEHDGVPFTLSSNLVYALIAALDALPADYYRHINGLARQIRESFQEIELDVLIPEPYALPAVTTTALPPGINSVTLGDRLRDAGYELSYKSHYLIERNWIQICLMGEHFEDPVHELMEVFKMQVAELRAEGQTR